ncbi:MAG TPA: hypothetical protein VF920_03705 [Dongiaceae bacterium]
MDIAAAGAAATQIFSAQRAQQVALSAIKQARVEGATLANLLSQATSAGPSAPSTATATAPISNDNQQADQPRPNLPRGSLVNILV